MENGLLRVLRFRIAAEVKNCNFSLVEMAVVCLFLKWYLNLVRYLKEQKERKINPSQIENITVLCESPAVVKVFLL